MQMATDGETPATLEAGGGELGPSREKKMHATLFENYFQLLTIPSILTGGVSVELPELTSTGDCHGDWGMWNKLFNLSIISAWCL